MGAVNSVIYHLAHTHSKIQPNSILANNQKTLNRKNYKPHRSLRANKTLKQLVILAVKSSKQEGLHFNQIKCVLKNSLNIQCSNFILKLTLQQLLSTNHLSIKNQFYKLA